MRLNQSDIDELASLKNANAKGESSFVLYKKLKELEARVNDIKPTDLSPIVTKLEELIEETKKKSTFSLSPELKIELKGEKGDRGDDGAEGKRGQRGEKGLQGIQGIQGEKGIDGTNGIDGRDGTDAKMKGDTGEQGLQGTEGVVDYEKHMFMIVDKVRECVNYDVSHLERRLDGFIKFLEEHGITYDK